MPRALSRENYAFLRKYSFLSLFQYKIPDRLKRDRNENLPNPDLNLVIFPDLDKVGSKRNHNLF